MYIKRIFKFILLPALIIILGLVLYNNIGKIKFRITSLMEKKATIWSTVHLNYTDGTEADDTFIPEPDFIRKCPIAVKTIIAYFSTYIDFDKDNNLKLAQALGKFATLQEAQENLLHNKEEIFKNIERERAYYANLVIDIGNNLVSFEFTNPWGSRIKTYVFRISKNGDIEYIEKF
jgi:hypothetical protein